MKTKDLLTIATAAIATAALSVATFGGGSLEAGNESAAAGTSIAQPKLAIHGVEFSLAAADARVFHAGDQPSFELKAVNTNNETTSVDVSVTLTESSMAAMISRVVRAPQILWTTTESLKLDPGEIKTVTLVANTNLPANALFSVRLADAAPSQAPSVGANYSTTPPQMNLSPGNAIPVSWFPAGGITALNFSTFSNAVNLSTSSNIIVSLPSVAAVR